MRKILLLATLMTPVILFAQMGIGIKAGVNFANVTKASQVNADNTTGFMAGIFLAPQSKGIISSRTELLFSRQGYDFKTGTNTGTVNLDYILLPQLMSINITKFFSIQLGAQLAFLINAKADSSNKMSSGGGSNPYSNVMDYYNKFDYGFAAGIEIHPFKGLLIGARYNISLGDLYNTDAITSGTTPPNFTPNPEINVKNNVLQIFAGWIFGGGNSSKKKQQQQQQQPQQ